MLCGVPPQANKEQIDLNKVVFSIFPIFRYLFLVFFL